MAFEIGAKTNFAEEDVENFDEKTRASRAKVEKSILSNCNGNRTEKTYLTQGGIESTPYQHSSTVVKYNTTNKDIPLSSIPCKTPKEINISKSESASTVCHENKGQRSTDFSNEGDKSSYLGRKSSQSKRVRKVRHVTSEALLSAAPGTSETGQGKGSKGKTENENYDGMKTDARDAISSSENSCKSSFVL